MTYESNQNSVVSSTLIVSDPKLNCRFLEVHRKSTVTIMDLIYLLPMFYKSGFHVGSVKVFFAIYANSFVVLSVRHVLIYLVIYIVQ